MRVLNEPHGPPAIAVPTAKRRPSAKPKAVAAGHAALVERASHNTLAANPLVGIRRKDLLSAMSTLVGRLAGQPGAVTGQYAKLLGEHVASQPAALRRGFPPSATVVSRIGRGPRNAMFRRMLQSYLALGTTLDRCVDEAKMDPAATERARFAVSLVVDASHRPTRSPAIPRHCRSWSTRRGRA